MSDRATRPLNQDAVQAADDSIYQNHAGDPRPNALYDEDGNRKPLDADDPSQAGVRQEWMASYKANGGGVEPQDNSAKQPDEPVEPCDKAAVDPLIVFAPPEPDDSDDDGSDDGGGASDDDDADSDADADGDSDDGDSDAAADSDDAGDGSGDDGSGDDDEADDSLAGDDDDDSGPPQPGDTGQAGLKAGKDDHAGGAGPAPPAPADPPAQPPPQPKPAGAPPPPLPKATPANPAITATNVVVLVKRPYTTPGPTKIRLKTDAGFDGTGLLTRSDAKIDFKLPGSATALKFDGTDNQFAGATLSAGFDLMAEGVTPSAATGDVLLTLTLNGGSKKNGPPAKIKLTSVQATLDICDPRVNAATDPVPLPTAAAAPAAGATPTDKFYLGRPLPLQSSTDPRIDERAMLIVKDVKPADFKGNLRLKLTNDQIKIFQLEKPGPKAAKEKAVKMPYAFPASAAAGKGLILFVEGAKASGGARLTGVTLGVQGLDGEADHVQVTVCPTEIVSNRKPADLKIAAQVPEKPERKTKSIYIVAPIIVGLEYPIELRPYIETAVPSAYSWTTASDKVVFTNANKEVVGLTAKKLSGALNDVELDLLLTTDVGKLLKKHILTSVQVTIDPITSGDNVKPTDNINLIKNPSGCVILTGAGASDKKAVPRYEITKILPDLKWKAGDTRIAWWILGTDAKGNNQYDGKADFMNQDSAKYGTKVQVFGITTGDILIQPYSGGYGYGMIRAHVVPIRQVKYRVSRVFTTKKNAIAAVAAQAAVPAQAATPAFPGNAAIPAQPAIPNLPAVAARLAIPAVPARAKHGPTQSHAEAKLHMKVSNIFLRQMGIEMIPDDSAQMTNAVVAANPGSAAVKAQAAVAARPATPAIGAIAAQPAVPARPAVPALPAIPAVAAVAANTSVGLPALDAKVVNATLVSPGHFDVEVNDVNFTFNSAANQIPAIQINARNEVISVAYIEQDPTLGTGTTTLSTALRCPANHAPLTSARQPEGSPNQLGTAKGYTTANFTLPDLGTPSTSLIPKTGIPPDTPAGNVNMIVLYPDTNWQPASPATRDVELLWGIIVPTRNMDSAVKAPVTAANRRHMYGFVFAHEMGHILGLGHRGALANPVTDGIAIPPDKNIMRPFVNPPVTENFDIIQAKAVRFSEVMNRNP